jgi:hypothetical protein
MNLLLNTKYILQKICKKMKYCLRVEKNALSLHPYRGMEQMVARRAHNPKAVGSSPTPATKNEKLLNWVAFCFLSKSLKNRYVEHFFGFLGSNIT